MVTNLRVEEWHSVHQRLGEIAKRRAALDADEARCLRDAERVRLWRWLGYVHMGEYLERELGYSPHTGAERMRVARELGELPQIEAALGDGALAYSAVRELSRIATWETEAEWLAAARGKNLRQLEPLITGRKRGDRPSDPSKPALINRVVRLELSPDVFALFRQAQAALADEYGGRLDDNAFIQALCRRALEGSSAGDRERPAHQISITVCDACKRGWQNGAGREIEVGPEVIERAQCDAEHLGSLNAAQPARVTSTVTPRVRRQVLARDHHCCTVPGCRSSRNIDLHHIVFQRDGGGHVASNVTTLCSGHHQQLHAGALAIRGHAPDGLEFTWHAHAVEPLPSRLGPAPSPPSTTSVDNRPPSPGTTSVDDRPPSRLGSASSPHSTTLAVESLPSHVGPETSRRSATTAGALPPSHVGPVRSRRSTSDADERPPFHVGPVRSRRSTSDADERPPCHVGPVRSRCSTSDADQRPPSHVGPVRPRRSTSDADQRPPSHVGSVRPRRSTSDADERPPSHVGPALPQRTSVQAEPFDSEDIARDARDALTTAGYSAHEARFAVEQARSKVGLGVTLEQLLREALRCCRMRGST